MLWSWIERRRRKARREQCFLASDDFIHAIKFLAGQLDAFQRWKHKFPSLQRLSSREQSSVGRSLKPEGLFLLFGCVCIYNKYIKSSLWLANSKDKIRLWDVADRERKRVDGAGESFQRRFWRDIMWRFFIILAGNVTLLDQRLMIAWLNSARQYLWSVGELLGLPARDPSYPPSCISSVVPISPYMESKERQRLSCLLMLQDGIWKTFTQLDLASSWSLVVVITLWSVNSYGQKCITCII